MPCLVLELAPRPLRLVTSRSRGAFEPIEMRNRSVFLVQILRRTSVQYGSTTVWCKRIVFAMNASEKDVLFTAK